MVGDTEQDIIMKLRDPKMCNAGFEQLVLMYRVSPTIKQNLNF